MKAIILTPSEFIALSTVDGTRTEARMLPEIKARLRDLFLIERREWPNGPMWRTVLGDRRVREGQ
jgi:hypothetical protein